MRSFGSERLRRRAWGETACAFNHRFPRLLRYQPMVRSLCLDTRYNARTPGSALLSRGSRERPSYGVARGTSMV
jgi:hypothetical protein